MTTSDGERRAAGREPLVLKVEYPGVGDLLHDYTENISKGGTFILTQRELSVGTEVRVRLSFPGLLQPLEVDGIVRWHKDGGADERGVGVEFALEVGQAAERLADMIERIQRGDPEIMARTLRILIVEDNPHVADLLQEGLGLSAGREYAGRVRFEFARVQNGRQALDALREQTFDLLIVDIYLPIMDGAQLIKAVRADAQLAKMPVIAVSAGGKSAYEMATEAGADFFVEKPMRLQEILRTVRKLVAL
jgi:uncharacterized protein (TIGR02266 family)